MGKLDKCYFLDIAPLQGFIFKGVFVKMICAASFLYCALSGLILKQMSCAASLMYYALSGLRFFRANSIGYFEVVNFA